MISIPTVEWRLAKSLKSPSSSMNTLFPDSREYALMSFEILSDLKGLKMYPGMIINYKVRPFLNIPLRWTTEITHCAEGHYFVDEQRFGPYSFWHHKHFFKKVEGGIEMTDIVDYGLPLGMLGQIANSIYVEQKLQGIFNYRNEIVHKLFTK